MTYFSKAVSLIIISAVITFSACAPTDTITEGEEASAEPSSQKYPNWYDSSEFSSDSLSYYGYGTAISSDSLISIANAKLQANATLEDIIAELMEDARESMEETGSSVVTDAEFIIAFGDAYSDLEEMSTVSNSSSKLEEEGYFRGYSRVEISKAELYDLIESGFKDHPNYWETLNSAGAFRTLFE